MLLQKALYELPEKQVFMKYKGYIMIGSKFLKELMLIKQLNQKSVIFGTIGTL